MEIQYKSTRGNKNAVSASHAILLGLADDGGLFVPTQIPRLDEDWDSLSHMGYKEHAFRVMRLFLSDFSEEELKHCIQAAYDAKFDTPQIAPLHEANDAWYLELFHGQTIAFKDMALSILPHFITVSARKNNENKEIVILTATSGDTGKAALAGFADVEGTKIIVFYPKDGVSSIQERQMVTQKGNNTHVVGIRGNFDDAQNGVKAIFTDSREKEKLSLKGYQFSSANSINIGRLIPQIVYYVYAYTRLVQKGVIASGEEINFVVPTGNFGNILAGYYAKQMGLPVHRLICASNSNKVLYDFFQTGIYDKNREFVLTSSPSMDILISSNLERLLYHIAGDDAKETASCMERLKKTGRYEITPSMREKLDIFYSGWASEEATKKEIRERFEEDKYVLDPHTAVASEVYGKYRKETKDTTPTVILSTASPFKFEKSVMEALGQPHDFPDLELANSLSEISHVEVPRAISSLYGAPVLHTAVCNKDVDSMRREVEDFLEIDG